MALFGKQPQGNPVQDVMRLRQAGTSDNQIVQDLQGQGFSTQQIFDAMSQADLQRVGGAQGSDMPPQDVPPEVPQDYGNYPSADVPPGPQPAQEPYSSYPQESYGQQPLGDERIHDVAEAIINEKWDELMGEVQKVVAWKDHVDGSMQKMSSDLEQLRKEFGELRQGVLAKVGEYDNNLRSVGSELKAVQKVFKDVIPSFTENVAELGRMTKGMKKK
jgi:hypothetical protein